LLDALETALGTARHGRRRQVETERRAATLLRARKPQPLKIMKMERKNQKNKLVFFFLSELSYTIITHKTKEKK
jgi:hypothetical protein